MQLDPAGGLASQGSPPPGFLWHGVDCPAPLGGNNCKPVLHLYTGFSGRCNQHTLYPVEPELAPLNRYYVNYTMAVPVRGIAREGAFSRNSRKKVHQLRDMGKNGQITALKLVVITCYRTFVFVRKKPGFPEKRGNLTAQRRKKLLQFC